MANKSRPKKTRGSHYKRYVYGVVQTDLDSENSENEDLEFQYINNQQNLVKSKKGKSHSMGTEASLNNDNINHNHINSEYSEWKLPLELILDVLEYTDHPYCINHLLVCRAVYWSFLWKLYEYPILKSNNLLSFLEVISGDNAAYVKKMNNSIVGQPKNFKLLMKRKFQNLVKCLDLTNVVQNGKNSYMSKLLRRTSGSLEIFVSSQSSFGAAPLVSIRSCLKLKILDLRLVSESVNLVELFKSIEYLSDLEQLCFPRSSVTCNEYDFNWPSKLWYLRLQGGITDSFALNVRFPPTITTLELAHCPHLTSIGLDNILSNIGIQLTKLSITYPMPKIGDDGADRSFWFCPNLLSFFVDVAYISWELFSEELLVKLVEFDRPLRRIIIESTGYMGMCEKVGPNDITIAVVEGRLPLLERVGLSAMLGWDFKGKDMEDMVSELDHNDIEVYKI